MGSDRKPMSSERHGVQPRCSMAGDANRALQDREQKRRRAVGRAGKEPGHVQRVSVQLAGSGEAAGVGAAADAGARAGSRYRRVHECSV